MVVQISPQLWGRLVDCCRSSYPAEACGFIVGDADATNGFVRAVDFVAVRNVAPEPTKQFTMEPRELTAALAQSPQERLLGVFHSHPRTAPVPSLTDLQTPWYTLPSYWIVSLQNFAAPSLQVYRLQRNVTPDGGSTAHTARLTYRLCELSFLP